MLTLIEGNIGTGKTLLLTIFAFFSKQRIISNFDLKIPYEQFNLETFLRAGYTDCILLLDEAYVYLESRDSGITRNKLMSYVLFQSRKKNVDMYLTVQLKSTIDVRYRELIGIEILCSKTEEGFKYLMLDRIRKRQKMLILPLDKAKTYFKMYDTNQVIQEQIDLSEFMTHEQKMKIAKESANELVEKYQEDKITKSDIKTYLFERQYPKELVDYIYSYIKELRRK